MKRLKTSDITSTNEFPVKSGTLDFIQDAYKDQFANIFTSLVEAPDPTAVYIISGCKNSGSGSSYNISSGVLYFNGEIYNFDGAVFTLSGLNLAYARINTTQYSINADPVTFTDGVSRNVHNINKIVVEATSTASGLPQFKDFVRVGSWLNGDTKEVVCNSTYITNNFDGTGLGKGERIGWAIMNGNNGTPNDDGLVVMAYGATNTTLAALTGSTTHAITTAEMPSHTHNISYATATAAPHGGSERVLYNGSIGPDGNNATASSGTGTPMSLMQPTVVRLRIMKL